MGLPVLQLNVDNDFDASDDSVKDKDYVPSSNTESDSEEETLQAPLRDVHNEAHDDENAVQNIIEEINEISSKKRMRRPHSWSKNILKRKRNCGEAYITTSGKSIAARTIRPPCGNKCRLQCTTKFTEDQRQTFHASYWAIGNIEGQRHYLVQSMVPITPKYRVQKPGSKRSNNYAYFFETTGVRTRVCKTFFLNTLDISNKMIFSACKKKIMKV